MSTKDANLTPQPNRQSTYRDKRTEAGFVRYELQVKKESKALFEALVDSIAEEIAHPWDLRRRRATARARLFEELLTGIQHEFFALKDKIRALEAEIATLSPSFITQSDENVHIPTLIQSLPNTPQQLKQLLANCHHQQHSLKVQLKEVRRVSEQYRELYEAATEENERLVNIQERICSP